jgi:hypothetical protein
VADGVGERARDSAGGAGETVGGGGETRCCEAAAGRSLRGIGGGGRGECDGGARGRWSSGRRCGVEVGEEGAERSLFRRSRKDSVS